MVIHDFTPKSIVIPLTRGYSSCINALDADLALCKWQAHVCRSGNIYAIRSIHVNRDKKARNALRLHREILARILGRELLPKERVDHKDGNGLNNRRDNLRLATPVQNGHNRKRNKNNRSGFKGVSWCDPMHKWRAVIHVNRKQITLGYFDDPALGHKAYFEAAQKYFGEFARAA